MTQTEIRQVARHNQFVKTSLRRKLGRLLIGENLVMATFSRNRKTHSFEAGKHFAERISLSHHS